jgi:mRNA interferase MazF
MVSRQVAPWQVWWTDFNPQVGREQAGLRPSIVVGTVLACSLPNGLAVVVPCTTTDRGLPVHPRVVLDGRAGVALCDQVKAISVDRLVSRHRVRLKEDEVDSIKFALRMIVQVS